MPPFVGSRIALLFKPPVVAAGGGAKTATFLTSGGSATDALTYNFTVDVGAGAADLRCFMGTGAVRTTGAPTFSSATLAGVAATAVVQNTFSNLIAVLLIAATPSASGSQTFSVTWATNTPQRCGFGAWNATGLTSDTANDSDSSGADPGDVTVDTLADGFAIGYGAQNNGTTGATWTGVTERFDGSVEDMNNTGGDVATSAGTLNVTCNFPGAEARRCMVVGTW